MRRYYAASFIGGFAVLSLELLGFRILAPYFGYSLYVYGSLIGLVLMALSVGYWLGGSWGDKGKSNAYVAGWLLAAALYLGAITAIYVPVLSALADLPLILGSLLSVLILFAPPMVALGSLSPYLIKMIANSEKIGRSASLVYVLSTIGSFAGTFATVLFAVPSLGAQNVLFGNALLTLLVAISLFPSRRVGMALLVVIIARAVSLPSAPTLIAAEVESPYNHLEVVDYGSAYGLRTERRHQTLYSYVPKDGKWPYKFALYDFFAIPPILNDAKTGLVLGLGGGMTPLLHEEANPSLRLVGVEIDPKVVDLGKEYFGLGERKNLDKIEIADARAFLRKNQEQFDMIEMDLFFGGVEVPFYLATKEFFISTRARLTPHGILAINIYDPSKKIIIDPILNTVASVYPYVYVVDAGRGSHFVMGMQQPVDLDILKKTASETSSQLQKRIEEFSGLLKQVSFSEEGMVFTDDRTPLEQLSHKVFDR